MSVVRTKITQRGNSLGVVLSREVLAEAGLKLGDDVNVSVTESGEVNIARAADDLYARSMEAGDACLGRYNRALAELAK